MSATGLDVFDKTLQTTNIWLDEIMAKLGPDRQVAWHVLGAVLHALRDRLQVGLAVHLGAQLPLLVRGLYYDQWHPSEQTLKQRSAEQFLDHVSQRLAGIRPVNVKDATHVTLQVLNHHLDPHQIEKVRQALPENIRALWPTGGRGNASNLPLDEASAADSRTGSKAVQHVRRNAMQVNEAMTNDVKIASPNQSIRDAARLMAQIDAGVLPVGENDQLVGMITDRDIAIRAVAAGKGPQTPIRDIMSKELLYCFEDDEVDDVVQNMADIKVRRLPVLNHEKRLVGILSLGDIALSDGAATAGSALCGISEPSGEHSQSLEGERGMRSA